MESLDRVWKSYQLTVDAMKVTRQVLDGNPMSGDLLAGTDFTVTLATDAPHVLDAARSDVGDLFILALWSVFERELRDHLQSEAPRPLEASPSPLHQRLSRKLREDIEYWKNDDILDLFKAVVAPDLVGNGKQIKRYRDWVAHRNPQRPRPANITPNHAYKTLSEIMRSLACASTGSDGTTLSSEAPAP